MIACFDVDYRNEEAQVACLVFDDWQAAYPIATYQKYISDVLPYQAGQFYKRELPCILSILDDVLEPIDCFVVDGHVWLNGVNKPGLGAYLYRHFKESISVIGVAKNAFGGSHTLSRLIFRGMSTKPLWITSAGVDLNIASKQIQQMHGNYRIPDLLKRVDQLARNWDILCDEGESIA